MTRKITGVSTTINPQITLAYAREILVAFSVAIVFGEISPKIRIKNVRIPVAIPAPTLPSSRMARVVAREDADRFTILLPIRIADNILLESFVIFKTHSARASPSSANDLILILLTVVNAVSAEEKNADNSNSKSKNTNCNIETVSNEIITPLYSQSCYDTFITNYTFEEFR